jgi:hypothetical protein
MEGIYNIYKKNMKHLTLPIEKHHNKNNINYSISSRPLYLNIPPISESMST